MRIMEKLKKISQKDPEIRNFCIRTFRFKKFLENARALLDFFDDGREKLQGEYIFDRHYVISLIDSVIERLGMMVYDACVLVPKNGEDLYAGYDKHVLAARNLISFSASPGKDSAAGNSGMEKRGLTEPEYQLLADALRWLNGEEASSDATVMGFMKQAFYYVIQGLESADEVMKNRALFEKSGVKVTDTGAYIIDLWKDGLAAPKADRPVDNFNSIPLKHLLMDTGAGNSQTSDAGVQIPASWVAAVSEYQLSLNSLKPDFQFRLETLASGHEHSDFIFIFADKSAILEKILPPGFHVEDTNYGQLAWNLDISSKTIEDSLMIIGRNLFH